MKIIGLFLFLVISVSLFGEDTTTISLGVGQQKVLNIPGLQRVAIGDPSVLYAESLGQNQIILTAKKHGRTTLILWLKGGKRKNYSVHISQLDPQGVVKDVASLLSDIEGLNIKVAENYIILDGEVYRAIDYLRIQKVMKIFPLVRSLVVISPNAKKGITEQLNMMFGENGLKDVRASVVGDMIFLEGFVADDREKIKALSIAESLGLKSSKSYSKKDESKTKQKSEIKSSSEGQSVETDNNIGQEFIDLITIGLKKMILLDLEFIEIRKDNGLKLGLDWWSVDIDGNRTMQNGISNVASTYETIKNPITGETQIRGSQVGYYPSFKNSFRFMSNINFGADLNLLANEGYAKILAKPKLICASGESAKFQSGGQIPIVSKGQDSFQVEYKDYGVLLDISPVADNDGNIITKIKAEVSEPDWTKTVLDMPSFIKRSVETTVTVPSESTIVLSGLFRFDQQKSVNKMAGLGHIPILGELFKNRNFQDGKSDLLIFVHPSIVTPDSNVIKDMIKKMRTRYKAAGAEIGFSIFD
jgi:pilus assembly protein CpaC